MSRVLSMLATLPALLAGCGVDLADPHGEVSLSLTGQAPSGAVYRLRDAVLTVAGPEPRVFRTEDDPDRAEVRDRLPVGRYTLAVGAGWRLERIADGQAAPVDATLLTESPHGFDIVGAATTEIVLRFRVRGEEIDLREGDLGVSIAIEEEAGGGGPVPPGLVTVRHLGREWSAGVPRAGLPVLFHGPDGALIGRAVTDAAGEASAVVADGSSVTVLDFEDELVTTFQQVSPGDVLAVGYPGEAPSAGEATIRTPEYTASDDVEYRLGTPCGQVAATWSNEIGLELRGCPGTAVPLLATVHTDDAQHTLLGYLAGSAVLQASSVVDLAGPWLAPGSIAVSTHAPTWESVPGPVVASLYSGTQRLYQQPANLVLMPDWVARGTLSWPAIDASLWAEVYLSDYRHGNAIQMLGVPVTGAPTTLSYAASDMIMPWVRWAGAMTAADGTLTGVEWDQTDGPRADGVIVDVTAVAGSECGDDIHWVVIAPASTAPSHKLVLPILPPDLAAQWSHPCVVGADVKVRLVETTAFTSYAAFRTHATLGERAGWALPAIGVTGTARYSERIVEAND